MKVDLLEAPSEDVRLEIIPLIDVIFCILTFFILAAVGLTRQQALNLDLPAAETSQPLPSQNGESGLSDRFYVSIDAFGNVYYEQQQIDEILLYELLAQQMLIYPQGLVVLYASQEANYGRVVEVLDLLRALGGSRVALATLPRNYSDITEDPTAQDPTEGLFAPFPGEGFNEASPALPPDSTNPLTPRSP